MPVYRATCQCKYTHDQFLKADRDQILMPCPGCGKSNTYRQVRDSTIKTAENNDVVGLLRYERKT